MVISSLLLLVILIALVIVVAKGASLKRPGEAANAPTCGKCGYIVRGIGSLNCPECGSDLREVGIMTPAMRRRSGPWPAMVLWVLLVVIVGFVTTAVLTSILPRLHSDTEILRFETTRGGMQRPGPPTKLSIDIEVRSWEYRWSWAKQTTQPPMREIVMVANETQPVRLTIDVDRNVCTKEPGPGQALPRPAEGLPLDEETLTQWLLDAGYTPARGDIDGPAILSKLNRAILSNDPDIDLTSQNLWRSRSGSRGSSGQLMGGITEGLALFWIAVGVIGCMVIWRRQRRRETVEA